MEQNDRAQSAEEIVREATAAGKSLRWLENNFPDDGGDDETSKLCRCIHLYTRAGADSIDALMLSIKTQAAEIAELRGQLHEADTRMRIEHCEATGYDCEMKGKVAELEAQLSASKQRERAAVESWRGFCSKCNWRGKQRLSDGQPDARCVTCRANNKCNWKWRGPQEAEKGNPNEVL